MSPLPCDHCGHIVTVPCLPCRMEAGCIGLCWTCRSEAAATVGDDPFETDEVPRVRHHADGTVEQLGDLDLTDTPEPTAPGFASDDDFTDIPF